MRIPPEKPSGSSAAGPPGSRWGRISLTRTEQKLKKPQGLLRRLPEAWFVCALFLLQLAVFLVFREESYPQVHDNLDLFPPHYRMMKLNHAWFAQGATLPILHGLPRDLFGSEFLLYNVLYILLPDLAAYLTGYFLKIAIGFSSFLLLARDLCGSRESFGRRLPILLPVAAAFGMLPVFPTYGIAFTSVPLVIWLLRRIWYREGLRMRGGNTPSARAAAQEPSQGHPTERQGARWADHPGLAYVLLFCYPTLSYFSYHGFFILCYLCAAWLILWVRSILREGPVRLHSLPSRIARCFPGRLFLATVVLSLGYIAFEYRLFGAMLLSDTVTIRTTMEHGNLPLGEALRAGFAEFVTASFHSQDNHTYLVLPVTMVGAFLINLRHIARGEARRMLREPVNGVLLWIALNCLNFGLYQYAPYRRLLEGLVPQLTGFEFARTAYFNTFLWYALFALVLCRLAKSGPEGAWRAAPFGMHPTICRLAQRGGRSSAASLLACAAALIVMLAPQVYNDFYYTVYNHTYKLVKHRETSRLNYREYYSADLFARILRDLDYQGEWSAAYGMHPAILNYNGISSLDGYIGFYPQSYKEQWERVEAPAFAGSPWIRSYFEGWGARVCLYSGSDENTYDALRYPEIRDRRLMADLGELAKLDCRYIFSRIEISNAKELGLRAIGVWDGAQDRSPYAITVYELPEETP